MLEKIEVETVLRGTLSLSGCSIQVKVSRSKLTLTGNAGVHYDSALALQLGPVIGYAIVSLQEIGVQ